MNDQITFDPSVEHPEPTGVPEDVNIDLPYPLLVATVNTHAIVAKIHKNEFFTLSIVDLFPKPEPGAGVAKPLKMANIRFGATPPNVPVGEYWRIAIAASAEAFYAMFVHEQNQKLTVPQRPSLAVIQGGVVKGS